MIKYYQILQIVVSEDLSLNYNVPVLFNTIKHRLHVWPQHDNIQLEQVQTLEQKQDTEEASNLQEDGHMRVEHVEEAALGVRQPPHVEVVHGVHEVGHQDLGDDGGDDEDISQMLQRVKEHLWPEEPI